MLATTGQDASLLRVPRISLAIGAFFLGIAYLSVRLLSDETGMTNLLLLSLVQITPLLIAVASRRLPFIGFVMGAHFVTYSVAKLNQLAHIYKLSTVYPAALTTIRELSFCSVLIIASYCAFHPFFLRGVDRSEFKPLRIPKHYLHLVGILCFVHTYLTTVLPTAVRTVEIVIYFVSLVLLFTSVCPAHPRLLTLYRALAVAAGFIHFLRTGMLVFLGTIGGVIFLSLCLNRKRINFFVLLAIVAGLCILQPVKGWYRNVLVNTPDATVAEKLGALQSLVAWKYVEGEELDEKMAESMGIDLEAAEQAEATDQPNTTETLARGFARIGDDSLERVLEWTPSRVPFWGGESYANIPFMFIPRVLWPSKPKWEFWNKFGRTYGYLSSDDYTTSVGIGYLGEAYMNFGYLGMYACAILVGLIVVLVERLSYSVLGGSYSFTYVCFLATVSSFAMNLGSMLNGIFLMTCLLALLRPKLLALRT